MSTLLIRDTCPWTSQAVCPLLHCHTLTHTHTAILFHKPKHCLWQPNAYSFRRDFYATYFHVGSMHLRWLILKSHPRMLVKLKTQQCHRAGVREREMLFSRHLEELSFQSFKPLKHTHLKALVFLPYSWGRLCRPFPCHAGASLLLKADLYIYILKTVHCSLNPTQKRNLILYPSPAKLFPNR